MMVDDLVCSFIMSKHVGQTRLSMLKTTSSAVRGFPSCQAASFRAEHIGEAVGEKFPTLRQVAFQIADLGRLRVELDQTIEHGGWAFFMCV